MMLQHFIVTSAQKLSLSLKYKTGIAFLLLLICFVSNGVISLLLLVHIKEAEEQQQLNSVALVQLEQYSLAYKSEIQLYSDNVFIIKNRYVPHNFRQIIIGDITSKSDVLTDNQATQVFKQRFAQLYTVVFSHYDFLEALFNRGDFETAISAWQQFTSDFATLTTYIDARQHLLQDQQTEGQNQINAAISFSNLTIYSTTSFSILLALFLLFLNEQVVVRPLNQLQQALRQVAQGNLAQKLDIINQDEIGQLAVSFGFQTQ